MSRPSRPYRPASALRFPCGHVEPERATRRRLRTGHRVVWVACRRCNVIAIAVRAA